MSRPTPERLAVIRNSRWKTQHLDEALNEIDALRAENERLLALAKGEWAEARDKELAELRRRLRAFSDEEEETVGRLKSRIAELEAQIEIRDELTRKLSALSKETVDKLSEELAAKDRELAAYKLRSQGQAELLACYRLGGKPKESTFSKLERAREMLGEKAT